MRRSKNLPHHIEFARAMQHTPAPVDAISFPPLRRPALTALVLMVAAMHAAVLWLLVIATKPHGRIVGTAERIVVEMMRAQPPAKAVAQSPPSASSQRPAVRRPPPNPLAPDRSPLPRHRSPLLRRHKPKARHPRRR
ncbi:hypothetical protein [Variovorax atrisoli]|uniref:hypothetical protein n=1 Tax=Variovorax atrisoli TaxID=3394203 RepID=UPI00339647FB